MFQKYEATPTGLMFGGVFALILALFGLKTFNSYAVSAELIASGDFWLVFLGDLIGLLVASVGMAMLGFGIYYYLNGKQKTPAED